jgi:AsmA-like C-terminal region
MNKPTSTALVRWSERGRALLALPQQGRALVKRVPEPVQLELKRLSSHGARFTRECFAGLLVVGLVAIVAGYGRLARGPIYMPSLVPPIEAAINGELNHLHVKIDDAVFLKSPDGPGVLFRLKNVRLLDDEDAIVAQAPYAAIGLSGSALLSGRIAPGSVDFIGPRLLLFYSDQHGLALSFSQAGLNRSSGTSSSQETGQSQASPFGEMGAASQAGTPKAGLAADAGRKINVTQTVAEVFRQARRGNNSYLNRFGVENATVVLSQDGRQTLWQVPRFSVDLAHERKRSILLGQAIFSSDEGNWRLEFKTVERPKRHRLAVSATIKDLIPSGLAQGFPALQPLEAIDTPISGGASVELSADGQFLNWQANLTLRPGLITVPWEKDHPMQIDGGDLHVRYEKASKVVEIKPSTLFWGRSHITVSGTAKPLVPVAGQPQHWGFDLKADQAFLAADEFGIPPLKLDALTASGIAIPSTGQAVLSRFLLKAGAASVVLTGSIANAPGSPAMQLRGRFSPMPLDVFKQIWPKFVAAAAREWTGKNVTAGELLGGTVNIDIGPGELDRVLHHGGSFAHPVNLDLQFADLRIIYLDGMSPVVTPSASASMRGTRFSVDLPQGTITLPSGDRIALHQGHYAVADLRPHPPTAVVSFTADCGTSAALQLLNEPPLGFMNKLGKDPRSFGGTASGQFSVTIPLQPDLKLQQVAFNGSADLKDFMAPGIVDGFSINGGSYKVSVAPQSVQAQGDILIKGVPAQMTWQRVFDLPDSSQPPVRLTATLDEAARNKLGIRINDIVKGLLPITLLVSNADSRNPTVHLQADLTNTQVDLSSMGWVKPAGVRAAVQAEIDKAPDGSTVLNDFTIQGDGGVNIDGAIALDAAQHLKAFQFKDFSFDAITHAQIEGEVGADGVLSVQARGPTYDGKEFFRSLFMAGESSAPSKASDQTMDMDLSAHFGSVVGYYDTTVQKLDLTLKKRKGRLIALQAKGQLNGQAPIAVRLEMDNGSRVLRAESRNAGDAFRLVGFYRQVQGGEGTLLVNLDAGAGGMMSGTLWARDFDVVSDQVVNNVLTDRQTAAAFGADRQETRQNRLSFNQLRAPFTVGHNQFTLQDAYMNGPILGATMRGTVDFGNHTVDLGGTYVPLYGLNSALGQIPILGNILVGRQGEGIVGITFAIKGDLSDPAVLVNPMSVVAPGIFRQIFEFNGEPQTTSSIHGGGR